MRIAIAQQNYHIGNFEANYQKIRTAVDAAKAQGADIVAFPELAVCGYPPRDFLEFEDFINKCQEVIEKLKQDSDSIAIVVGAPSVNPVIEGKDLFNSAYFIADGEVKQIANKALLPTYDIFDEYRYFEPATEFSVV
ncbi:MAG: nitrilase-related carbon-nitrogen hydrolase, partial [Chitinophagales bacterium]